MLADDEARALGHCVVKMPTGENKFMVVIQGLTAEDFYCGQHQPAPVSNNTGESDG